jgi:hypothetical protein
MTLRDRRAIRLAAGIVILGFTCLRVLPFATRSYRELGDEVAARRAVLTRMRDAIDAAEALGDSSEAVRQAYLALAPKVLGGESEAAATASLTGHLAAIADRSLTTLEGAEPRPDSLRDGGVRRITMRASFEGDTRGIAAALRAIDTDPVALATGAVRIVAPDPGSGDGAPEVLKGEIEVSGWFLERRAR